jgi:hypothetical protein
MLMYFSLVEVLLEATEVGSENMVEVLEAREVGREDVEVLLEATEVGSEDMVEVLEETEVGREDVEVLLEKRLLIMVVDWHVA